MLKIKNWDKYQHYKPKNPKYQKKMSWFKLYGADLLNDLDWSRLKPDEKVTLIELWCLASESEGILPSVEEIAFRLRRDEKQMVKLLTELQGWLEDESIQGLYEVYTTPILENSREEKRAYTMTAKAVVTKAPSLLFAKWWDSLPTERRTNRKGCEEKWKAKKLDKIAPKIISWTNMMKNSRDWKEGFNPNPLTILNQERWGDSDGSSSIIPKGVV
jgi:hypothetical protein